jgi:hypothetical protein
MTKTQADLSFVEVDLYSDTCAFSSVYTQGSFLFLHIDASHRNPNTFFGPQKPPKGLFIVFLSLGKLFPAFEILFGCIEIFPPENPCNSQL